MPKFLRIALALFIMSVSFFLAALEIPHIGEGAPDWHTVKRPQIPVQSISSDSCPPPAPDENCEINRAHPPIALDISTTVCVSEPVLGWRYDCEKKQWVQDCVGSHAVSKWVTKTVTANWIDTIHCYAFYDDYGRLKMVPEYR